MMSKPWTNRRLIRFSDVKKYSQFQDQRAVEILLKIIVFSQTDLFSVEGSFDQFDFSCAVLKNIFSSSLSFSSALQVKGNQNPKGGAKK